MPRRRRGKNGAESVEDSTEDSTEDTSEPKEDTAKADGSGFTYILMGIAAVAVIGVVYVVKSKCICLIGFLQFTCQKAALFHRLWSIPPQANAFLIMVQKRRPQIEIATSIGRIASIDAANGFLYTGNPNDINSQVRYVVSNSTFSDPSGRPITLSSLRPSQRVRITHATTQTASIPPQTIAFHVQLL